jgi:hypothetical protein
MRADTDLLVLRLPVAGWPLSQGTDTRDTSFTLAMDCMLAKLVFCIFHEHHRKS